jgi:hypothetical protein
MLVVFGVKIQPFFVHVFHWTPAIKFTVDAELHAMGMTRKCGGDIRLFSNHLRTPMGRIMA